MALAMRAADAELVPCDPEPDSVIAGNPVTSNLVLASDDKLRYGIWQITPGTSAQVATPGMFVVLRARNDCGGRRRDVRHRPRRCLHLGWRRAHHLDRARDAPQGLVRPQAGLRRQRTRSKQSVWGHRIRAALRLGGLSTPLRALRRVKASVCAAGTNLSPATSRRQMRAAGVRALTPAGPGQSRVEPTRSSRAWATP